MALVKMAGPLTEINGKVGSLVWRHDHQGQHCNSCNNLESGNSPAQTIRRNAWRTLVYQHIRVYFTAQHAAAWQQYAYDHPITNSKGETIILTWWSMFISFNINRVIAGQPVFAFPPGYAPI